jgi:hypothetical protein
MYETRTHAHPAELILAFLASHVAEKNSQRNLIFPKMSHALATAIFLYSTLALTTLLRVTLDPICSFTVIPTFLQPHLGNGTNDWAMVAIDRASKTKLMICTATHGWHHSCEG